MGDFRLAARRLAANPTFLLFAVASLALGLALTITSYAVLEALAWPPSGITDAERVAVVVEPGGVDDGGFLTNLSAREFDAVRRARTLTHVAATARFAETLAGPAGSSTLAGEAVTGDFFDALGVAAAIGRTIQTLDEQQAAAVLVLSDFVWRTRFAADPDVVGRTVRLGGQAFEIVGVAPRVFQGTHRFRPASAWIPLSAATRLFTRARPGDPAQERRSLWVLGRLAPDRSLESAATEIATIGRTLDEASPRRWFARSLDGLRRPADDLALLLLFIIGMVLVVACTNLANLLLARGAMRQHEIAVRRALGASRWRLIREQLAESAMIAVGGGLAALAATHWLLQSIPRDIPSLGFAFSIEPVVSPSVLFVAAGAVLLSILTFGLAPAIQLTARTLSFDLATDAGTGGKPRALRHRQLVRWQVAIAASFFLVVSLAGRVLLDLATHDSGINLDGLAVATAGGTAPLGERRVRSAVDAALEIAQREPGVDAAAASSGLPFGVTAPLVGITTPERPFVDGQPPPLQEGRRAHFVAGTNDIFRTLGIPIVAGRPFNDRDDASAPAVAIVNEKMARDLFGTRDATGRELMFQYQRKNRIVTIVGVARDTDTGMLFGTGSGTLYVPFAQDYVPGQLTLTARGVDTDRAVRALQIALRQADPDISTTAYGDAAAMLTFPYYQARIAATATGALGLLTLLLAMVGLYGVQSQTVTQRTREVGVRVALGATARQIERLILKAGFIPVVQGIVLGLVFGSLIRLMFRVTLDVPIAIVDPLALALVPVPVLIAAFLACMLPAHRAARVDPKTALRHL